MRHTGCLALLAACGAVAAQAPPELLRVSLAGPATWRARLQPTNLGSMFGAAAAEAIWRPYVDELDRALRGLRGADDAFARERGRLLDYAGTLHVVVWLEQAEDALHLPRWSAALIAEPDGRTDLAAMAGESAVWLDRLGERASNAWRELRAEAPAVHDGRLVVVLADAVDRAAAVARARAWRGPALDPRDVAAAVVEVAPMLGLLRDRAWERGLATDLLGAAAQRITVRAGAYGPEVTASVQVAFAAAGERGVFAGLAPSRSGLPQLDAFVPDAVALQFGWQVDWPAAWLVFCRAWGGLGDRSPATARERLGRQLGVDVAAAVLPHLRDDVLLLCGGAADGEGAVPFGHVGLVVPVRDEAALVEGLTPLAEHLGGRPWRSDDGAWQCTLGELHLVVGDGVLCLGSRDHGPDLAAAVRARAADRRGPELARRDGGEGVSGAGRVGVASFAAGECYALLRLVPALLGLPPRLPAPASFTAEVARWEPLLRQHRLDQARLELRGRAAECGLRLVW